MKIFIALCAALLLITQAAFAQNDADWKSYDGSRYGFSFSYPANWSLFENVNTDFKTRGLPSAFNLCLTPGPVKTLSCQVDVYVIPETQFTPPSKGVFLGAPVSSTDTVPHWTASFSFTEGGSPIDGAAFSYVPHNGYIYLWVQRGSAGEPLDHMVQSFHFAAPK